MTSRSTPSVLFIGHSYMSCSADFCEVRNSSNFGLPARFHVDNLAMPGATLVDLPPTINKILSRSPDIFIFNFDSFDQLAFHVSVLLVAHVFRAIVRFVSF